MHLPRLPAVSPVVSRWFLRTLAATAGVALVSVAVGCNQPSGGTPEQGGQAASAAPLAVKVVHPAKTDVRRRIERPGYNIEAYERTLVYAKIPGYVRSWNEKADMGDHVRKDDILAELSIPEMDVELLQKKAAVRQAGAEIKQAEAAKLKADAELVRARSQYERLNRLTAVLDKDQREEYRLGFEAAQAAVAKAQADVDFAHARKEVAEADQLHVEALLKYKQIKAPFDGIITGRRSINTGDFVQPAAASKGESLFIVERIKPVRVFINVPDLDAVWVRDGDVAFVRVQGLPGQSFKGTVTRASKSLHPQARTLRTQIDLPNTDEKLLPGMFVNATIIAQREQVWSLPATAVVTEGEHAFCYRVENGKAVRTPVLVGLRGSEPGSERIEIIKKQTKPARPGQDVPWEDWSGNEVIVASETGSLTDGQAVSVPGGKR
jgi:RND family efflux transporter MFP subunit